MKRLISLILAGTLMAAALVAAPITASAAPRGTDVLETFEAYPSDKALAASWMAEPKASHNKVTNDTKTSYPDRANGSATGNYRSLRLDYNTGEGSEGWLLLRQTTENPYPLVELVERNGNGKFVFYAKADKPVKMDAGLNIKDDPCTKQVTIGTEWKRYELDFRDLRPRVNANKDKSFIDITREGLWPAGKQEPYLVGFYFGILSEQKGTLWIDTLTIEGDYISENDHKFTTPEGFEYDTQFDRDGKKPADFVPVTDPKPTSSTGGSTNKPPVSSAAAKPPAGNTTSTAAPDSSKTDSSSDSGSAVSSDVSSAEDPGGEINSSGGTAESDEPDADVSSTADVKTPAKENGSNAWIVILVIAIIAVLAGGGCAFYFLYWKKRT